MRRSAGLGRTGRTRLVRAADPARRARLAGQAVMLDAVPVASQLELSCQAQPRCQGPGRSNGRVGRSSLLVQKSRVGRRASQAPWNRRRPSCPRLDHRGRAHTQAMGCLHRCLLAAPLARARRCHLPSRRQVAGCCQADRSDPGTGRNLGRSRRQRCRQREQLPSRRRRRVCRRRAGFVRCLSRQCGRPT
jgi:hypothetical protein